MQEDLFCEDHGRGHDPWTTVHGQWRELYHPCETQRGGVSDIITNMIFFFVGAWWTLTHHCLWCLVVSWFHHIPKKYCKLANSKVFVMYQIVTKKYFVFVIERIFIFFLLPYKKFLSKHIFHKHVNILCTSDNVYWKTDKRL